MMCSSVTRCLLLITGFALCADAVEVGTKELVYQWSTLEFGHPGDKGAMIGNGSLELEKNLIAGIKVFKEQTYVTIPRWKTLTGIPMTLAKVVSIGGQGRLFPYPSEKYQKVGDCNALQFAQSMEIDPNTGLMYVIDTGRVGIAGDITPLDLCPAKIVVFDLDTDHMVAIYELPADVVGRGSNFLNDIVLDYVDGAVRYAYITDVGDVQIVVFDFLTKSAWSIRDASMLPEVEATDITINGNTFKFEVGIDGIAMSSDFRYVYYCAVGAYNLYRIPTSSLRQGVKDGIELVGKKLSQGDGMAHTSRSLYYGGLGTNSVDYWRPEAGDMTPNTQTQLVRDDVTMQWVDGFAVDEAGWLWFISNRIPTFFAGTMNFSDTNIRIWKVFVDETSYLHDARDRTSVSGSEPVNTALKGEL